jgi:hypothetical protein
MTDKKDDFSPDEAAFLNKLKGTFAKLGTDNTAEGKAYRQMRDRTYREAKATRAEYSPKKTILQRLLGQ